METVHFIGIGGAGMSGLARLLLARGVRVSGSDVRESEATRALAAAGAEIRIGHRAENLNGAQRVVYSAAVPRDNPELTAARRQRLPIISRAQLLGEVMRDRVGIAIAGTHGKTTTTAMVASIFQRAGADPTVLIGGDWAPIGGTARVGKGRHFISEACEAYDSFLELQPQIAVITNIESDHLDWHKSEEGVVAAFRRFLGRMDASGCAVVCRDDLRVRRLLPTIPARVLTYGLEDGAELTARDLEEGRGIPRFTVMWRRQILGEVQIAVPGRHNVLNALAAIGVAVEERVPFAAAAEALSEFSGVSRRFETLGEARGILIVDDYAHHPTEIDATLIAARGALGRRLIAVFQPHLYSRTQQLLPQFARAFREADSVIVTDIYPARERPIPGVDGRLLATAIAAQEPGKRVRFLTPKERIGQELAGELEPGDAVIVMGAGDIRDVGEQLLAALRGEHQEE